MLKASWPVGAVMISPAAQLELGRDQCLLAHRIAVGNDASLRNLFAEE
jgi:hypothetical protein